MTIAILLLLAASAALAVILWATIKVGREG